MDSMEETIDRYWRAANFLTVKNMYLANNEYRNFALSAEDVKPYGEGHWGTSPGINFIYAHLNRYIKEYKRRTQLIIGPGHGGNALIANLQMESNALLHTHLKGAGMQSIRYEDIRTEASPFLPGTIYDGGELGYSLAVAFGAVLDDPAALCVCIIGDGEAETGTLSASWNCADFLDAQSGFVLPILHLNGYKMGGSSILSKKSDTDLANFFRGLGYKPMIVNGSHKEMVKALDISEQIYCEMEQGGTHKLPLIVLRSPKGWTAPNAKDFCVENTLAAHKNPLRDLRDKQTRAYLSQWLQNYGPCDLFDSAGNPAADLIAFLPDEADRLGNSLSRYRRERLNMPDIQNYQLESFKSGMLYRNIEIVKPYLLDIIRLNQHSFRIMSPDELQSNLLESLKTEPLQNGMKQKENGRVMEILNENICQAWMQGYTLTGRNAIMISYEAFMPIISSMVSQFAKWIFQSGMIPWRKSRASLTYLLTSLCWSNTYSHQNPSFIHSILGQGYPFVRVYMPLDANCLLASMEACLTSENQLNVIVSSKQKMPQWVSLKDARASMQSGVIVWKGTQERETDPDDLVLVSSGDYSARECYAAMSLIKDRLAHVNIRLLSVVELTSIGPQSVYPHALDAQVFDELFGKEAPIVFSFHGYVSVVQSLLYDRCDHRRITFLGYRNQSVASMNDLDKLIWNQNSRYHIVLASLRFLYLNRRVTKVQYDAITQEMYDLMGGGMRIDQGSQF